MTRALERPPVRFRGTRISGSTERSLHPLAWWVWALGLAAAASRTTNPLLLLLILGVVGLVVAACRGEAPWARALKYYLAMALVVVAIRVVFRVIFGGGLDPSDHVMFRLPSVPLPSWAAGVQLGGPVTVEGTLAAVYDGLRLGTIFCCIGAANALANPRRTLRLLPPALYELSVAVVVAITAAPQLVESVQRVRRARRLRASSERGLRAIRAIALPVLQDALDRSLLLAAAMDSRGYGRSPAPVNERRATSAVTLLGLAGIGIALAVLIDRGLPRPVAFLILGAGAALCAAGLVLGGRCVRRTHYRPDPWLAREWLVALLGVLAAVGMFAADAQAVAPSLHPLAYPSLPVLAVATLLAAALPTVIAPRP